MSIQINHDEEAVKKLIKFSSQSEVEIGLNEIDERLNEFLGAKKKRDVTEAIPVPDYLGLVKLMPYYYFEGQAKKHFEVLLNNN